MYMYVCHVGVGSLGSSRTRVMYFCVHIKVRACTCVELSPGHRGVWLSLKTEEGKQQLIHTVRPMTRRLDYDS